MLVKCSGASIASIASPSLRVDGRDGDIVFHFRLQPEANAKEAGNELACLFVI